MAETNTTRSTKTTTTNKDKATGASAAGAAAGDAAEGAGPATGAATDGGNPGPPDQPEGEPGKHRQGSLVIDGQSAYFVPAGRYRGRVESAVLRMSLEQQTPFYDCVCVVLDDIVVQGRSVRNARLPWSGFLKAEGKSALRTIRSMQAAGCTFPGEEYEDYTGLGTLDVELDVEEEEPYTPEPTEENPEPKTVYRSRVAWVNRLARGMASKEVDEGARKQIGQSMKALIKMAKSGPGSASDPNDGVPMVKDPKTGKMVKMF